MSVHALLGTSTADPPMQCRYGIVQGRFGTAPGYEVGVAFMASVCLVRYVPVYTATRKLAQRCVAAPARDKSTPMLLWS